MFRYQPSPVEDGLATPEDDSAEVADWFNTQTDPEIAQAVAQAVAEARTPVAGSLGSGTQYPPLSQQAQPPATDYTQQAAPRHGAEEQ